ncbi:hypothetical protein GCM10028805_62750 [Spirosoma harenae]
MKTILIYKDQHVEYVVMQEPDMVVKAAKVDNGLVADFGMGTSGGVIQH